ncbi:hypothetical protein P4679_24170 [Priestia megaterium]|uniref:hypothetical protein n=1 Tax=Priestia megaterium TaxID=1404 RepID=UPI002E1A626D|nr:hypothetical protein [Priestia megaterium]
MIAYIVAIVLSVIQLLFSRYINTKKAKPLHETSVKIKKELVSYLERLEKEHNIEAKVELYRLRVLGLFTSIHDEDKKEEIRTRMKEIVLENKGQPKKLMFFTILPMATASFCAIFLAFAFRTEPIFLLSIALNILVIFLLIARKMWVFLFIFGAVGFILYPLLPAHLVTFALLSPIVYLVITVKKAITTKNKKSI